MEVSFRQNLTVIVKDLLKRIGFEADVQVSEAIVEENRVEYHCEITLQDGQSLLIGQHGANIGALLHVVKLAVRKEMPKDAIITLDVNHYFEEKKGLS